jgi:hypothetical protein
MLRQFVEGAEKGMLAALALVLIGSGGARAEGPTGQAGNGTPVATTPVSGAPVAVAGTPGAVPGDIVDQGPFEEATTVSGKVDVDLKGVWLLVGSAEVAPGKYKNFQQLLKITEGKSGSELHLLDVHLPDPIQQSFLDTRKTMALWVPSPDARKTLGADWSKLPLTKQKARDEFLYGHMHYLIATPSEYASTFPRRTEPIENALKDSKLAIQITEDYVPRPARPNGSQVARRTSIYGVRSIDKNELKGDMFTAFLAMGAGQPLPLDFHGTFVMYRLAPL